jgi:hypothetical protein
LPEHVQKAIEVGVGQAVGFQHVAHVVDHEPVVELAEERQEVADDGPGAVALQMPASRRGACGHATDVGDEIFDRPPGTREEVETDRADAKLVVAVELVVGEVLLDLDDAPAG